jgi:hypothetical protein
MRQAITNMVIKEWLKYKLEFGTCRTQLAEIQTRIWNLPNTNGWNTNSNLELAEHKECWSFELYRDDVQFLQIANKHLWHEPCGVGMQIASSRDETPQSLKSPWWCTQVSWYTSSLAANQRKTSKPLIQAVNQFQYHRQMLQFTQYAGFDLSFFISTWTFQDGFSPFKNDTTNSLPTSKRIKSVPTEHAYGLALCMKIIVV